ncbi:MAG: penicillin-binding transpeptidase domain-containing protein, partial [Myxococcota bacterium]
WPAKRWAEVTFANVAFGQGFTATPLQVAMSLATIANGGKLLEPRLVRQVRSRDGRVVERTETRLVRRVFSPEVARQTAWAMALVTREGGTAPQAAMRHFHVAGKTGTAQKVNPKTRRYDSKMWVASFVGFFPAERPRVLVAVMIDEPQQNHYGGVVAAPVFKQIAEEAAHILGILPVPDAERFTFPPPAPDDPEALKRQALAPPPPQEPNPLEGFVALHTPPEPDGEDAPAPIRDGALVTPDFTGLTLRGALARARTLSATLVPAAHGWGKVVSQSPEPGRPWRPEVPLVLELLPSTEHSSVSDVPSTGER